MLRSPRMDVLVVEDEPVVRRGLKRFLEQAGWCVTTVGRCADARVQPSAFHSGVFDIDLPDGDGVALARELLEAGTVGRALFFSAHCDAETVERAQLLGPVLQKAKGPEGLLSALVPPGAAAVAAE